MRPKTDNRLKQRGQALVEAALFLPVFLVIIAGIVEVSQLVVTQNRVSNAARESTRFGSNGGEDVGMRLVMLNTVTQTLQMEDDVWDMWVIRATVNQAGDGFSEWSFEHIYGFENTEDASGMSEDRVKQQVLAELHVDHNGNQLNNQQVADLEIIGTYLIHDVESILGLEAIPWLTGLHSITAINVMRINSMNEQSEGCSAFPIGVHEGVRSVTAPGEGSNPYPDVGSFSYPPSPPSYNRFVSHVPNIPLANAQEGYLYRVQQGFGSGNFGWLKWNQGRPSSANILEESLSWPGNSTDYANHGDNQIYPAASAYAHVVRGYVEPGDSTDISLHVGDWVAANTGSVNSNGVRNAISGIVDRERTLRLIVWGNAQQQGNNGMYQISGFAVFKIHGYQLSQGNGGSWILAEFVRWDDSCGQPVQGP